MIQPARPHQALRPALCLFAALRESTAFTSFSQVTDEQRAAFRDGMAEIRTRHPAINVADFVDHIDHVAKPDLQGAGR